MPSVYHIDSFWQDIHGFISSIGIDGAVFPELLHYQKSILRFPKQRQVTIDCGYDFYHYFHRIYDDAYAPLEKKHNRLTITVEKEIDEWDVYAREIIWYGKRRSATLLTNAREHLTFSER